MKIAIEPSGPVSLDVTIPGSKSFTNRALIAAALAEGASRLTNASFSDDSRFLASALNQVGVPVETLEDRNELVVHASPAGMRMPAGRFSMGNAGTALRFFTSFLCTGRGRYVVDGDSRMRERPIGGLVDALRQLGVDARYELGDGVPPVILNAEGIRGGRCAVTGEISSQFVSSLLLSAPGARGDVTIEVTGEAASKPYIEITLDVMRQLGVEPERDGYRRFTILAAARYGARELAIESDGASAGYFLGLAAATGGRAVVRGVGAGSHQGELKFAKVLEQMGCSVRMEPDRIEIEGGPLRGVDVDMNDMPDSVQTLACVALFASGPTRVRNVANLRVKETDRIAAVASETAKLGAKVQVEKDGFSLTPPKKVSGAEIDTYKDHRMAMSFSVAAAAAPGVVIRDPECVSKSFPGYFEMLESLGVKVRRL